MGKKRKHLSPQAVEVVMVNTVGQIAGQLDHIIHGKSMLPDEMRFNALYIITRTRIEEGYKVLDGLVEDGLGDRLRMIWHNYRSFREILKTFPSDIENNTSEIERFARLFVPFITRHLQMIDHETSDKEREELANSA